MKNWKTTLAGCVTAALYGVISFIQLGTFDLKDLALSVGIAVIGALAKDFNISGTTMVSR